MIIAGEASGDLVAAELIRALREEFDRAVAAPTWDYQPLQSRLEPRFFGAGGPRMAATGASLAFDMTEHSVIGLIDVIKKYPEFRRMFKRLLHLALERKPDVIVGVDFSGFNRPFAHAIKSHVRSHQDWFHTWNPKIVQYVSPQVWASREDRAYQLARDYDLLLSIIPFEKEWYAKRVPQLPVEFVGHPILDRYKTESFARAESSDFGSAPNILLLPGSRSKELAAHLPVMLGALSILRSSIPNFRAIMVLPNDRLAERAKSQALPAYLQVQIGSLAEALEQSDLAIAATGTVTLECAYFGVPTVAMYKCSWLDYQLGKRVVKVKYLAMPNLLANEPLFPEFIQHNATAENIARASLEFLRDPERRSSVKTKLTEIVRQLGIPGAGKRAARAIYQLLAGPDLP